MSFHDFVFGKVNKIRDEVGKCTTSDNVQMFDVSCNVSADISFVFANVSDELLQVISKCPNKSCVPLMYCLHGSLNSVLMSFFPLSVRIVSLCPR